MRHPRVVWLHRSPVYHRKGLRPQYPDPDGQFRSRCGRIIGTRWLAVNEGMERHAIAGGRRRCRCCWPDTATR